jgi:hypothetical protein
MAKLITVFWRDIPAQIIVRKGRESAKVLLPKRFQEAIDRAAMRAGRGRSDAYLEDWKRSPPRACGDDIHAEASAEAQRLDEAYADAELEQLIRGRGLDPSRQSTA